MLDSELLQIKERHKLFLDLNKEFWLDETSRIHILSDIPKLLVEVAILYAKYKNITEHHGVVIQMRSFQESKDFVQWYEREGYKQFFKESNSSGRVSVIEP